MKSNRDNTDVIRLYNMAFFGYHGPRSIEREIGQHYQVDVEIFFDIREASQSDDFSKTIDYAEIYEIAREIITKNSFKLIESMAERIAAKILAQYNIQKVNVSVRKLKPAIQGIMDHVEITISRTKEPQ